MDVAVLLVCVSKVDDDFLQMAFVDNNWADHRSSSSSRHGRPSTIDLSFFDDDSNFSVFVFGSLAMSRRLRSHQSFVDGARAPAISNAHINNTQNNLRSFILLQSIFLFHSLCD
jgi:hypothetical protein